jgi:tetratricopeptide (TPR) repeat protein
VYSGREEKEEVMGACIWTLAGALALSTATSAPTKASANLAAYMAKLEEAVERGGSAPPNKYRQTEFSEVLTASQELAEMGAYAEAAKIHSALLEGPLADDWRRILTERERLLSIWAKFGKVTLPEYRQFYIEIGPAFFRTRLRPMVTLWRMTGVDETEKYVLLKDLFRHNGDREGERLVLEAIAESKNSGPEAAANALLAIANRHYETGQYDQAEPIWLRVRDEFPGSAAWGKAVFNLGWCRKERGDYERAIACFSSILEAKVNDLEPGGHIMEVYRNYRPRAQWEIGHCRFAQKKFHEALAAYRRTASTYPFQSWCGNEQDQYRYLYDFQQGLCYDWLGDPVTAVRYYYKAIADSRGFYSEPMAHLRLADLYEAAGQMKDLLNLLDAMDGGYSPKADQGLSDRIRLIAADWRRYGRTGTMRRILELRAAERKKDWDGLIGLLKIKGTNAGPEQHYVRQGNWEAVEAARLLAKHPDETVPLLTARLAAAKAEDRKWLYYALGRCGTDDAVATLKDRALRDDNVQSALTLVYSLSLAGEKGEAAIAELEKQATRWLQIALLHYRQGRIGDRDKDVAFPEARRLPTSIEEMKLPPSVEQQPG